VRCDRFYKLIKVDRFFPSTKLYNCCQFKNDGGLSINKDGWFCNVWLVFLLRCRRKLESVRTLGMKIF
jgi:hypothetical protein